MTLVVRLQLHFAIRCKTKVLQFCGELHDLLHDLGRAVARSTLYTTYTLTSVRLCGRWQCGGHTFAPTPATGGTGYIAWSYKSKKE